VGARFTINYDDLITDLLRIRQSNQTSEELWVVNEDWYSELQKIMSILDEMGVLQPDIGHEEEHWVCKLPYIYAKQWRLLEKETGIKSEELAEQKVTKKLAAVMDQMHSIKVSEVDQLLSNLLEQLASRKRTFSFSDTSSRAEASSKSRLPIKYRNNIFSYGLKSAPLKKELSFATFCDFFYKSCPQSGKMEQKELLERMKQLVPEAVTVDVNKLRQWVKDFNRWANNPKNFGDQLRGKKLLSIKGGYIERHR
jgi:hypothetical protein